MSVTRRGFLGICGASIAGVALAPALGTPDDYEALLGHLEKEGLRHDVPQFEELGKIFAEEIAATMGRPGFSDRVLKAHAGPPCTTCPRRKGCARMQHPPGWKPGDPNPHGGFGPEHMADETREQVYGTSDLCTIYELRDFHFTGASLV